MSKITDTLNAFNPEEHEHLDAAQMTTAEKDAALDLLLDLLGVWVAREHYGGQYLILVKKDE